MRHDQGLLSALAGAPLSVRRRALNRALLRLPLAPRRRLQYLLAHDRPLHLEHPRRWSEKLNWRMVHDRREIIAMTCDKLACKRWVRERVDADRLAVPRTVWAGSDPAALARIEWPESWVVKPNHGTGLVQLGRGVPDADRLEQLTALGRRWLDEPGPEIWGEWGYSRARRLILVEEAVPGTPPSGRTDYKFFVVDGEVRLVLVDSARFGDHSRSFRTPNGSPVVAGDVTGWTPPPGWNAMTAVAADLGADFDAIRVDLYVHEGRPWFGELTAYDGSGLLRLPTPELDLALGAAWRLPRDTGPSRVPAHRLEVAP